MKYTTIYIIEQEPGIAGREAAMALAQELRQRGHVKCVRSARDASRLIQAILGLPAEAAACKREAAPGPVVEDSSSRVVEPDDEFAAVVAEEEADRQAQIAAVKLGIRRAKQQRIAEQAAGNATAAEHHSSEIDKLRNYHACYLSEPARYIGYEPAEETAAEEAERPVEFDQIAAIKKGIAKLEKARNRELEAACPEAASSCQHDIDKLQELLGKLTGQGGQR